VSRARHRATIVHVAESFASGTASAITDFVRNYPEADHHLIYSFRPEAQVHPRELDGFMSAIEMPAGTLSRIRFLRRRLRGNVIVHAHSSKAGGYVRMAIRRTTLRPIVYSPHCYAFERRDVTWPVRQWFRVMEWLLSFNTTAYGACSPREARLSRWSLRRPPIVTLPNVQPRGLPRLNSPAVCPPRRIIGNGRLGTQKDPEFFAAAIAAAAAVHPDIEAVWIGDGDARYADILRASSVKVTGWLSREQSLEAMAEGDLYLHSASWEGFPISILEAAGMGLPVITRRRPYLSGVDLPVLLDDPTDFAAALTDLIRPGALEGLRKATANALTGNTDAYQRTALRELYGPLTEVS
jgi:glycosyltransferase involved in cell wall biosynthesis